MVRMSDIFKKVKEKKRRAKEEGKEKPLLKPGREAVGPGLVKEEVLPEAKVYEREKPELEERKETKVASSEETVKLYDETISLAREILKGNYEAIETQRVTGEIERIIEQLDLGNEKMLMLALIRDSLEENYLLSHSVNVCIFSIEVGLGLGYERSKLVELGVSALLHDVGMVEYLSLANQPRKLTKKEFDEIKNHPIKGSEILQKFKNLDKAVVDVCRQHHERMDGSGYPEGLKRESINEYARIVGVVDVYESRVHRRAYRNEHSPLEVMGELQSNRDRFEFRLIKILIERVGIFPIGTLVELNTKEVAQVVRVNRKSPLSPVVKIIYDASGERPKEPRTLDLATQATIYIKKTLRKDELKAFPPIGLQ